MSINTLLQTSDMTYGLVTFLVLGIGTAVLIAIKSRIHKRYSTVIPTLSSTAIVDSPLAPQGSVLIDGELWLARSASNILIPERVMVRVVGIQGHVLLVSRASIIHKTR